MKLLPMLPEASPLVRAGIYLVVPVILFLALPILLLFILALYLLAIFHGARVFVFTFTGKQTSPDFEFPPPHFLEAPAPMQTLPDESPKASKG